MRAAILVLDQQTPDTFELRNYSNWQWTDKKGLKRVDELIATVRRDPFDGIGKPEPLKYALAGYWSRRITEADRLVYKAEVDSLLLALLRYHC